MLPNWGISTFGLRHTVGESLWVVAHTQCTIACCPLSLRGWELKDHLEHKVLRNLCILQPMVTMKSECLGMIESEGQTGVRYLKNNPYCQGLACKFIPNLAKTHGRAGSVLLLS